MRPDRLTKSLSFLGITLFLLSCERTKSPLLDNYNGDYHFTASFETLSDSINIFAPYKVLLNDQGDDTFISFSLQTAPGEMLDKNVSKLSTDKKSIIAYFKAPFTGELLVIGHRPNERQDTVRIHVSVANNFKVISPKYAQINKEPNILLSGYSDNSPKVTWYIDSEKVSTDLKVTDTITTTMVSKGTRSIWAFIKDTYGNIVSSDTVQINFVAENLVVRFDAYFEKTVDSLKIFTPYKVILDQKIDTLDQQDDTLLDQENDTFASFSLITGSGGELDTNTSKLSPDKKFITAYFKAPFTGELLVIGHHSNGRNDTVKIPVSVANNFKIISPQYAQINKEQYFFLSGHSDTSLKVTWYIDNKVATGSKANDTLITTCTSPGIRSIWVSIKDTYGNIILSEIAEVNFVAKIPSVKFAQESITVKACELVTLDIAVENCDSVKWLFKGADTTFVTTGNKIETRFRGNRSIDTVIATGFVTQNVLCSFDTLIIKITQPVYTLGLSSEKDPDTVFSGKWNEWAARAFKDSLLFTSSGVKYTWSMSPDNLQDSSKFSSSGDTIGLFFSDSVQSFNLRVYGIVTDVFGDQHGTDTLNKRVVVRSSKPRLISSTVDTVSSAIFIKDNRKFTVQGMAPCGTLDSIFAFWPEGTVDRKLASNGNVVFSHKFEPNTTGKRVLKFIGYDNSHFVSDTLFDTINVRLGAPVLWGDTSGNRDTIFIKVNKGYSGSNATYYAHVNSFDTNGTIQKYYWSNNPWPDSGNGDSFDSMKYDIGKARLNTGEEYYVYGRDNDGIVNGGKFIVFADSAPPAPSVFDREFAVDSVRLLWNRVLDKKDSLDTQIKIMITYGSTGEPDQVLLPYRSAAKFATSGTNGEYFSYTFKPEAKSGSSVRWRVWLKDSRGSETAGSDVATFILP